LPSPPLIDDSIGSLIRLAIREDLGGLPSEATAMDRTVQLTIPRSTYTSAAIVAKARGIISGLFLLPTILREYDSTLHAQVQIQDGQAVIPGTTIATLQGPAGSLLSAERVLLNFISRLSGVATLTRQYVEVARRSSTGHGPAICDTRKTTPGWRVLEKYAVRCGGGVNHRMGLYDGVMLKDNHLAALQSTRPANETLATLTRRIRQALPPTTTLWLEVDTLAQLKQALPDGGADIILLDNMSVRDVAQAVIMRNTQALPGHPLLEVSGGITLENLPAVAATGVDRVSIGALTHHAVGLDLSMEFS
jgi:nicotinate-nucleotide pyrophosphorylase (carboxylating)